MGVKRIVANLQTSDPEKASAFYQDVLGLDLVMDHGWLRTYAGDGEARAQVGIASEGGSGAPVPLLSIEVDDVDAYYARAKAAQCEIVYDIVDEPWGVRRFFLRDPFGNIVNILMHH
ncbi:VOC family protein [Mesorhizobium xinjiangense]|uniref:VOC family protein n=1 Tax=Mesorhizobium xinjiangense TaxID=2678685 RepID=UPI0012ECE9A3|nr:VOC family protein [Mesorhizobium xinjiangense]